MAGSSGVVERAPGVWTRDRLRSAGLAGIAGGVGLTLVSIVHNAVGLDPETAEPGLSGEALSAAAHGIAYALMLAALLAATTAYRPWFGAVGRGAAVALAVSLAVLGVGFLVAGAVFLAGVVFDLESWYFLPVPIAFAVMFLASIVLGLALLLRRLAPWPVPALFVAPVLAAAVVIAVDGIFGVNLTAAAVEAPLYLAFAALGYYLLAARPG
jgi:hypothetical protein